VKRWRDAGTLGLRDRHDDQGIKLTASLLPDALELQFAAPLFELQELIQHALERLRPAKRVALRTIDAELAELVGGLERLDRLTHGICADALGELNDRLGTSIGLNVADETSIDLHACNKQPRLSEESN
jgi:hypothetical protein